MSNTKVTGFEEGILSRIEILTALDFEIKKFFKLIRTLFPNETRELGETTLDKLDNFLGNWDDVLLIINKIQDITKDPVLRGLFEHEARNLITDVKTKIYLARTMNQDVRYIMLCLSLKRLYYLMAMVYGERPDKLSFVLKTLPGRVLREHHDRGFSGYTLSKNVTVDGKDKKAIVEIGFNNDQAIAQIAGFPAYHQVVLGIRTLLDNAFRASDLSLLYVSYDSFIDQTGKLMFRASVDDNGQEDSFILEAIERGVLDAQTFKAKGSSDGGLRITTEMAIRAGGQFSYRPNAILQTVSGEYPVKEFELIVPAVPDFLLEG